MKAANRIPIKKKRRVFSLENVSTFLSLMKDFAVIIVLFIVFVKSDLWDQYLLSQKIQIIEKMPIVSMDTSIDNKWHYFKIARSSGPVLVQGITLFLHYSKSDDTLIIKDGRIFKSDMKNSLKRLGLLNEPGEKKCNVGFEIKTNLGVLSEELNPYVLVISSANSGDYEQIELYRNNIF